MPCMKRRLFLISLFLFATSLLFAGSPAPDFHGGNGTILYQTFDDEMNVTVRKYETAPFKGGDCLSDVEPALYDFYTCSVKIADFIWYKDTITIHELCEIEYPNDSREGELWFQITTCGKTGWICYYRNSTGNLYDGIRGMYTDVIQSGGKTWNIRSLNQSICVYENLNVRDAPGLAGKKVFLIEMDEDHYFRSFTISEITAETETIDGLTDHWVKIEYQPGKFGWIFGGYTGVERGGPKFMLPEDQIDYMFGDMP